MTASSLLIGESSEFSFTEVKRTNSLPAQFADFKLFWKGIGRGVGGVRQDIRGVSGGLSGMIWGTGKTFVKAISEGFAVASWNGVENGCGIQSRKLVQ